jgi:hypothetical protein
LIGSGLSQLATSDLLLDTLRQNLQLLDKKISALNFFTPSFITLEFEDTVSYSIALAAVTNQTLGLLNVNGTSFRLYEASLGVPYFRFQSSLLHSSIESVGSESRVTVDRHSCANCTIFAVYQTEVQEVPLAPVSSDAVPPSVAVVFRPTLSQPSITISCTVSQSPIVLASDVGLVVSVGFAEEVRVYCSILHLGVCIEAIPIPYAWFHRFSSVNVSCETPTAVSSTTSPLPSSLKSLSRAVYIAAPTTSLAVGQMYLFGLYTNYSSIATVFTVSNIASFTGVDVADQWTVASDADSRTLGLVLEYAGSTPWNSSLPVLQIAVSVIGAGPISLNGTLKQAYFSSGMAISSPETIPVISLGIVVLSPQFIAYSTTSVSSIVVVPSSIELVVYKDTPLSFAIAAFDNDGSEVAASLRCNSSLPTLVSMSSSCESASISYSPSSDPLVRITFLFWSDAVVQEVVVSVAFAQNVALSADVTTVSPFSS